MNDAPTLRGCILALNSWTGEWSEASRYDRALFALNLSSAESDAYRRGSDEVGAIDPRPGKIDDGALSQDGAYSLGLAVVLLATAVLGDEGPPPSKAALEELSELVATAELVLGRGGEHATLRGRLDRVRSALPARATRAAPARQPASAGALWSVRSGSSRLPLALAATAILGAGWFLLRGAPPPDVSAIDDYRDLLPVQTLLHEAGHVTVRMTPGWERDREASADAIALWRRISKDAADPGLQLTIADTRGRALGEVVAGRVRWADDAR